MSYEVKDSEKSILKTNHLFKALQLATKHETYSVFSRNKAIYQNDDKIYNFDYKGFKFSVDSKTKRYVKLPLNLYPNSQKPSHLEFHTGAYNYLYTEHGYDTIDVIIDLSKLHYRQPNDDSEWAGYIIINHQAYDQIDIGLYACNEDDQIHFKPFYYYMGGIYPKAFKVLSDIICSIPIQEETSSQDLKIQIQMESTLHGWSAKYTNLNTGQVKQYQYNYPQKDHQGLINRFLIGVSLVPVGETLWDPTCGAIFSGIVFEKCLLNQHISFHPNSPVLKEGYTQGIPCAYVITKEKVFELGVSYNL